MNRDDYYKDLQRRQEEHLKSVSRINGFNNDDWQPCMHDNCTECVGTGVRRTGGSCVHMISCPCPRCSPRC